MNRLLEAYMVAEKRDITGHTQSTLRKSFLESESECTVENGLNKLCLLLLSAF